MRGMVVTAAAQADRPRPRKIPCIVAMAQQRMVGVERWKCAAIDFQCFLDRFSHFLVNRFVPMEEYMSCLGPSTQRLPNWKARSIMQVVQRRDDLREKIVRARQGDRLDQLFLAMKPICTLVVRKAPENTQQRIGCMRKRRYSACPFQHVFGGLEIAPPQPVPSFLKPPVGSLDFESGEQAVRIIEMSGHSDIARPGQRKMVFGRKSRSRLSGDFGRLFIICRRNEQSDMRRWNGGDLRCKTACLAEMCVGIAFPCIRAQLRQNQQGIDPVRHSCHELLDENTRIAGAPDGVPSLRLSQPEVGFRWQDGECLIKPRECIAFRPV